MLKNLPPHPNPLLIPSPQSSPASGRGGEREKQSLIPAGEGANESLRESLPPEIFKAYDIRGIVGKTLTAEVVEAIGHAIGSEAAARGQHKIAIGRDGRLSGPELIAALARGIQKSGIDVIDVGCVPTPIVFFAPFQLQAPRRVKPPGNQNPPDYNGLKM